MYEAVYKYDLSGPVETRARGFHGATCASKAERTAKEIVRIIVGLCYWVRDMSFESDLTFAQSLRYNMRTGKNSS